MKGEHPLEPSRIRDLATVGGCTEDQVVRGAIERADGNVTRAARALGIHRQTLWYHLRRLALGWFPKEVRARVQRRFFD